MIEVAIALVLPNFGGCFGALLVEKNLETWYDKLKFPSICPANWVFGPVWIYLYTSMGYASYLVWRDGNGFSGAAQIPLCFYGLQLLINWTFCILFFEMRYFKIVSFKLFEQN